MSETNCMTCMIGNFKHSLCDERVCKKYARNGKSEDFIKLLLDKDLAVVVRCRDCRWYEIYQLKKDGTDDRRYKPSYCKNLGYQTRPDWFCADGEEREDGKH